MLTQNKLEVALFLTPQTTSHPFAQPSLLLLPSTSPLPPNYCLFVQLSCLFLICQGNNYECLNPSLASLPPPHGQHFSYLSIPPYPTHHLLNSTHFMSSLLGDCRRGKTQLTIHFFTPQQAEV